MQEYWINVYQYNNIKDFQAYSHLIRHKYDSYFYAAHRELYRSDCKCIYRIHIKMKPVKPKYNRSNHLFNCACEDCRKVSGHTFSFPSLKRLVKLEEQFDKKWLDL